MKKHRLMAQTCLAAYAGTLLVPGLMAPAFAQGVDGATALEEIRVEGNQTADRSATDAAEGPGVTQTNAGPVDGYRAITADSGTRTRTPIKEIPQSIQVIPRGIIEDQQADTITEITRNVSGVQGIERREGTQQLDGDFLVRGQFTETYVNGRIALLDQGLDPIGTISIERIEVIKGPTSALFTAANGAPISGLVNIVEKTPERDAHYIIEGNGGSFNFANVAFDVNQPLVENGDLSFRITGDIRTSDDFVEALDDSSVGIFPTLRYDNDRTVVQLRGRYQYQEFDLYPGLPTDGPDAPATGFGFAPDDFAAAFDQPRTELEAFSVDFLIEHQFTDNLSAKFDVGFQNADGDQFSTVTALSPFFFAGAPGELTRLDNVQFAELDLFDVGGEAVYKRDFGSKIEQTFLVGIEHQSTDTEFDSGFGIASFPDLASLQAAPFAVGPTTLGTFDFQTTTGIFQSQTTFADRLHFLGAVSVSDVTVDIDSFVPVDLEETILSPRVGLAFEINDYFTPFVGWGRGFRTPPTVAATTSFFTVGAVEIERNEQVEAGVRFENPKWGLSGSAAFFNLKRDDAAVFATVAAQTGLLDVADQRSRGFEIDTVWQPNENWRVLANYAFTDAEITDDDSPFLGNDLQRVPRHSGRLAVRYDFTDGRLEGLGLGAGVTGLSERAGDLGNTFFTEALAVFDAQASYKRGNVEAKLSIENLFDNDAFVPNFLFQGNTGPLTPINVRGGIRITF